MDRIPAAIIVARKAGKFCLESAALLLAIVVLGVAILGG